tara:strand:+ start:397 stop:1098 length:702 start_codon:yes stop_codon:yes gene_type:complete
MTITEIIQNLRYKCDESLSDSLFSQAEKLEAINDAQIELYTLLDGSVFVDNVAFDDYTSQAQMNGNWYIDDLIRVERTDAVVGIKRCSLISPYDYSEYMDNSYSVATIYDPIAVHWTSSTGISDGSNPRTTGGLRVFPTDYTQVRIYYRMRPRNITSTDVSNNIEIVLGNSNQTAGFDTVEPLHHLMIYLAEANLWKNDNNQARADYARSKAMGMITVLNEKTAMQGGKPING